MDPNQNSELVANPEQPSGEVANEVPSAVVSSDTTETPAATVRAEEISTMPDDRDTAAIVPIPDPETSTMPDDRDTPAILSVADQETSTMPDDRDTIAILPVPEPEMLPTPAPIAEETVITNPIVNTETKTKTVAIDEGFFRPDITNQIVKDDNFQIESTETAERDVEIHPEVGVQSQISEPNSYTSSAKSTEAETTFTPIEPVEKIQTEAWNGMRSSQPAIAPDVIQSQTVPAQISYGPVKVLYKFKSNPVQPQVEVPIETMIPTMPKLPPAKRQQSKSPGVASPASKTQPTLDKVAAHVSVPMNIDMSQFDVTIETNAHNSRPESIQPTKTSKDPSADPKKTPPTDLKNIYSKPNELKKEQASKSGELKKEPVSKSHLVPVTQKKVKKRCCRLSTKILSILLIVMTAAFAISVLYILGYFPSIDLRAMFTLCPAGQVLYVVSCYEVIDTPFLVSTDANVNSHRDGCSIPSDLLSGTEAYIDKLVPSCNMHDICYYAVDALNYTIGVADQSHMIECDTLLINGWNQGCKRFQPKDANRLKCEFSVTLWSQYIVNSRKNMTTNKFWEAYQNSVKSALKSSGTASGVTKVFAPYARTPFVTA